jgi:tetratricopeptide (TPR) repeat protein
MQRSMLRAPVLAGLAALFLTASHAWAQNPPPPPPAPPPKTQDAPKSTPNSDQTNQADADQPKFDPLRAERDIEVGKYYLNKGDPDAAIDRFLDAADHKPGDATPYRYLGEAYEKKGQKKPAAKAYQKYLDMYPKAEDGEKIRKKIEKLNKEIAKDKALS